MKLTNREKQLILILGIVAIGLVFMFLVKPKLEASLAEKEQTKQALQDQFDRIQAVASTITEKEERLEKLRAEIAIKAVDHFSFEYGDKDYFRIINNMIISSNQKPESEDSANEENTNANTENAISSDLVPLRYDFAESGLAVVTREEEDEPAAQTDNDATEDAKEVNDTSEQSTTGDNETPSTEGAETTDDQTVEQTPPPQVKLTEVTLQVGGDYQGMKDLIASLNGYDRKIVISKVTLATESEYFSEANTGTGEKYFVGSGNNTKEWLGPLKGEFTLQFYSSDLVAKYIGKNDPALDLTVDPPKTVDVTDEIFSPFTPVEWTEDEPVEETTGE